MPLCTLSHNNSHMFSHKIYFDPSSFLLNIEAVPRGAVPCGVYHVSFASGKWPVHMYIS